MNYPRQFLAGVLMILATTTAICHAQLSCDEGVLPPLPDHCATAIRLFNYLPYGYFLTAGAISSNHFGTCLASFINPTGGAVFFETANIVSNLGIVYQVCLLQGKSPGQFTDPWTGAVFRLEFGCNDK